GPKQRKTYSKTSQTRENSGNAETVKAKVRAYPLIHTYRKAAAGRKKISGRREGFGFNRGGNP
ncbi:MAG: hypothetical protein LBS37_01975, partial [Treponema sp.]|nr:hypothetical protein [Treponema sp.]